MLWWFFPDLPEVNNCKVGILGRYLPILNESHWNCEWNKITIKKHSHFKDSVTPGEKETKNREAIFANS